MPEESFGADAPSLVDALSSALQEADAVRIQVALLDALAHPSFPVKHEASKIIHAIGANLCKLIVKDCRFPGEITIRLRCPNSIYAFYPNGMTGHLAMRLIRTRNPEGTLQWLEKVLQTTSADIKIFSALWGVPVKCRIELTSRVAIVPVEDLPDSPQKRWIEKFLFESMSAPIFTMFDPPSSVLVSSHHLSPYTLRPNDPETSFDDVFAVSDELADVGLALTLIGPRAPVQAAEWFAFDDPDLEEASPGGRSQSFIEVVPSDPKPAPTLDPDEAPVIVQAYLSLPKPLRDRVRVALQRLNQAQRRRNVGDKAVELSTALESLMGDNATTEMTHKIRTRTVRLIGGPEAQRRRNSTILNKAYKIRSSLVHTGKLDIAAVENVGEQKMTAADIIKHTTCICADLIKIIIRRGSIPDWSIFDITEHHD